MSNWSDSKGALTLTEIETDTDEMATVPNGIGFSM